MSYIDSLPKDSRGYRVPWFVAWFDGKPEFRVADERKFYRAIQERLCWICGRRMTSHMSFVIGPMCAINRISADPPSHLDCALYAVENCPFLSNPNFERRVNDMPEGYQPPPGIFIKRNPGISLIWTTKSYEAFPVDSGYLFEMGEAIRLEWFREGRIATEKEIRESIESGCPILKQEAEKDGPEAIEEYERRKAWILSQIPEELNV